MDLTEALVGKTLKSIDAYVGSECVQFETTTGEIYRMLHRQDCCESVSVDDIVGDLDDLIGSPILIAREDSNTPDKAAEDYYESYTWTFYNLATVKGYVTIKWYGSSNGYYSESVDFEEVK